MTTAQPGQEQRMEPGADYFGNDEAQAWLNIGRVLVAQGILKYERAGDLHTVTITTRPTADLGEDGELVAEARLADDCHQMLTCDPRAVLALRDRLTLYGEALADAQEQVGAYGYSTVHGRRVRQSWAAELLDKIDAVLSRSGG